MLAPNSASLYQFSMGMLEMAGAIISHAQQRAEGVAQNIANATTAGYKSRRQFSELVVDSSADGTGLTAPPDKASVDFTEGKLRNTGNPLDFAVSGQGFFTVRSGGETLYTRDGQFTRGADGRLLTPDGAVLQSSGGDLVLGDGSFQVLPDGTVVQDGQPTDKVTLAGFADTRVLVPAGMGMFSAPASAATDVASPQIHQGMLETSNVSTAEEMLALMTALRSAESGQKIAQVYDDLIGRAISTFGQS